MLIQVCVNQVSDFISKRPEHAFSSRQVIPALGLAWSEQVNTRLLLQRHDRASIRTSLAAAGPAAAAAGGGGGGGGGSFGPDGSGVGVGVGISGKDSSNVSRTISVTLASHLPEASVDFYVDEYGVHGIES